MEAITNVLMVTMATDLRNGGHVIDLKPLSAFN